ncbi:MAG: hypothetical protein JWQ33_2346 [Ramlibacter sp.]|nr:hypothetical protein [Ramlibacter sp.]
MLLQRPTLRLSAVVLALAFSCSVHAEARLKSELVAEKLVRQASGEIATVPAKDVRPGDLVVYTAHYKNYGDETAKAVVATVPVPPGMDYQGTPQGAKLVPSSASIDGTTFAAIPLTRKVKTAQGKELVQEIPLSEYRALRWNVAELSAGASLSLKLTAKVNASPAR